MTLTTTEIAIASYAVALLTTWSFAKGDPLSALTRASVELFGEELHGAVSNVQLAERQFAPTGALWNNAEVRLNALRAVVKFCR